MSISRDADEFGDPDDLRHRPIPLRALGLSVAALAVPVLVSLFSLEAADYETLLWLLALVPALLLSYYRGWRGSAIAVAVGMLVLVALQLSLLLLGREIQHWELLGGVVVADVLIAFGIGAVTEKLHRQRARAEELSLTDELTGIPNRRYARAFLEREFAAARRGRSVAVVLFDLDRFKTFNDTHGHTEGDEVLRAFAALLDETTRRMSLSARFGGEEFITILSSCDVEGALSFANRVLDGLRALQLGEGRVTVSAGIAVYDAGMESPYALIAAADRALYEAKAGGRDRICIFDGVHSLTGS